jgi:glycosyltransferase involved in cell wall biosynthesis
MEARRLLGWPADRPIFFTLRRHEERYGIDIAIRAMAPLASTHTWLFYVGGDGALRPKLEALARELGLSDRVRFTGRLTDEELSLAYQAADAFLLPTNSLECFGLIILEALACGCPVIATDAGAIPEIMKTILPDFIVPAGDPIALQEKIMDFLELKLQSPPPEELTAFALSRYGKPEIVPRLLGLLQPYHDEFATVVSQSTRIPGVSDAGEAQEPPNV